MRTVALAIGGVPVAAITVTLRIAVVGAEGGGCWTSPLVPSAAARIASRMAISVGQSGARQELIDDPQRVRSTVDVLEDAGANHAERA
jgi:hypothetical protein